MYKEQYDITCDDLNPALLFACTLKREEDETNYHCHDFIEFAIILRGKGQFYINGQKYDVKEGDLIILNPGTYHKSLVTEDKEHRANECYLSFAGVQFRDMPREQMPLFEPGKLVYSMPAGLRQEVFKLCTAMSKEYEVCRTGRYFMLKAYLIQLLCLLVREQAEAKAEAQGYIFKSVNKKYVVNQIKKYLDEHYQEKISLDQIARNMYLSTFYISKIFKSETGDTPINYLIRLRMERAREVLQDGAVTSIQEVAASVGYEDAYHFSKLFKKYYGVAPSRYRNI